MIAKKFIDHRAKSRATLLSHEPNYASVMTPALPAARASVRCKILGHKVHHTKVAGEAGAPCARCGGAILDQSHSGSRVAHTLSCFFGKHGYVPIATRAAHHEYLCEKCGHSLLFELTRDRYTGRGRFEKRVSYACGLVGHRVHVVTMRSKTTEYACLCGHPFVKAESALTMIRHPLACVLLGHFVTINDIRGPWAEYLCRRCGHPFYFRIDAATGSNPALAAENI
jgi:DNA-directed RNA polymerase subunit RPC12/RpoP